uniref:Uncharacterized protein n=1 Tax=Aegilops tauschii subsp. strangulata TaxID=200361 RepID=A0A453FAD4_AEGTS
MIPQPENCKLMNPSSNMSSMEEPLLPLFQRNQKYSSSKQDRSKSCDVPNRCAPSFHPDTNVKASLSTRNHPPATNENTDIVSTPTLQRVRSSPSIFTSIKEAPCAHELGKQSPSKKETELDTMNSMFCSLPSSQAIRSTLTYCVIRNVSNPGKVSYCNEA